MSMAALCSLGFSGYSIQIDHAAGLSWIVTIVIGEPKLQ